MKNIIVIIILFFILGCTNYPNKNISIGGDIIYVEIADNVFERQQGLMYREELCNDCGMLFIFEKEDYYSFWMKNTLIPLDMIFIDKNLTVVDIIHAVPCIEYPCESYISDKKALYVLETNMYRFNKTIMREKAIII